MQKHGFLDDLRTSLDEAGVRHVTYDEIGPNPVTSTVDRGAHLARKENCDLVIGLGGGSPMDSAKAIAVAAVEGTPFWRFAPGGDADLKNADALPIMCLPSTSGTGSEVDQYAVVSNPETEEKPGLGTESMYPAEAIVDPEITHTMPPHLTATTGVDVLIHALEALVSTESNPMTDAQSRESLRLVGTHLRDAYRDPDRKSREGMAAASTLAGMAISSAGTGLVHALEHPVSGHHREIAHAEGLAALTLPVIRYNRETCREKYRDAAELLGGNDLEKTVQELLKDLDMPTSLKELDVTEEELEEVAEDATRTMEDAMECNPADAEKKDLARILRKAHR